MSKTAFPVEELVLKPTPKACENQVLYGGDVNQTEPVAQFPEKPPEVAHLPKYQDLEAVVVGPRYGDIVVKFTDDGSLVERYAYRVTDEDQNEVAAKTDTREIPPEANIALLKAGWFCTNWGENYTSNGADYLATLGAACKQLADNEGFDENPYEEYDGFDPEEGAVLLAEDYQPDALSATIYEALMAVYYSRLLRNGACHKGLRKEVERRIDEGDSVGPTEAINQIIRLRQQQEGQSEALDEVISIEVPEDGGVQSNPVEQVFNLLNYNTVPTDIPNTCINYLPEFSPETPGPDYWRGGLATDRYVHLRYHQMEDRYVVNTELVEKDGEEILQVGVATAGFAFYEQFKKVSENEYLTSNTSGSLPSIYCAAVVREMGSEIKNLPSLDEPTVEGVYLALAEAVVKIFKTDQGIHEETLRKLNDITSAIQSQAIAATADVSKVDQEDLPDGATGDGQHGIFTREQFEDSLVTRLPDGVDKLEEVAGRPMDGLGGANINISGGGF